MICVFAEEIVDLIVDSGTVLALVRHLQAPPHLREGQSSSLKLQSESEIFPRKQNPPISGKVEIGACGDQAPKFTNYRSPQHNLFSHVRGTSLS